MNNEETSMYEQMQEELKSREVENLELRGAVNPNMFNEEQQTNLVKWQLDIKEELDRIEKLLRKQRVKIDEKGNENWVDPPKGEELFNEYGINEVMTLIQWYLNKNIILSNFAEEDIKMRVHQFADELISLIYTKYKKFGLDTKDKQKHFPMICLNIVNIIEASYYRALKGGERESLRTARTVTQTEPLGFHSNNSNNLNNNRGGMKLLKPSSWLRN